METKNIIIQNFANSLLDASNVLVNTCGTLTNDNLEENMAILRTLNVLVESLRSQTVNIQHAIDSYNE